MARSIKEIHELHKAIQDLHKFCNGGAVRKEKGNLDKCHAEFNRDDRFSMAGTHKVFYSSNVGYYGNIDCYTQIELPESTRGLFWRCFDEYLNDNQDTILNDICQRMRLALSAEASTIVDEIGRLQELVKSIK